MEKEVIDRLEASLRFYGNAFEVLHFLTTQDERGVTLYQTLVEIEELITKLSDPRLQSMYNRLVEGHRTYMPSQRQVLDADYRAFYGRLIQLTNQECTKANDAFIELKAAAGLEATNGIWGPKGWRPPGA